MEQQKNQRKSSQKSLEGSSSSFDDIVHVDQLSKSNNTQQSLTKNGSNNQMNGDAFHEIESDVQHTIGEGGEETDDEENLIEAAMVSAMSGQEDQLPIKPRRSLPPPPRPEVTWEQYINSTKGMPPCLGRQWDLKVRTKNLKATVAMVGAFPFLTQTFYCKFIPIESRISAVHRIIVEHIRGFCYIQTFQKIKRIHQLEFTTRISC